MLPNEIAHYCQKCLAANPMGLEFCGRCGTRLMLIVEPPAMRFETGNASVYNEDHLLERVSALENVLARLTERLEQTLDLLLRQAQNTYLDHTLIETLVSALNEAGVVRAEKVYEIWQERCQKDSQEQEQNQQREGLCEKIIASYQGAERELFARYLDEGFDLLGKDKRARGIRSFERAAAMAPDNALLLTLIGKELFGLHKMTLAKDYLERAFKLASENSKVCLLLGLACADEGETQQAQEFLGRYVRYGEPSFAASYALGRLLAAEGRWKEALVQFKRALAASPSAEANYVLGTVYYELERDRMAARHLRRAIEMDGSYAAPFFMLGLVLIRAGELEAARAAFDAAYATSGGEPVYRAAGARRRTKQSNAHPSLLFGADRIGTKHLLTGGDKRLVKLVFEDALHACAL